MRNSVYLLFLFCFSIATSFVHMQEMVMFIHVPKCGGVTVLSALQNEYSQENILNCGGEADLVSYHLSLFEFKQLFDVPQFKLITFLRHPVDRVLSEQRYCMGRFRDHSDSCLRGHRLPPEGDPIYTASNIACKMLSGLNDADPSISIEMHLEHAKKALKEQYFFVGITEKMEESIQVLYSQLGWKIPEKITRFNISPGQFDFSEEVLQGIAERNKADIELYELALELFESRKKQLGPFSNQPFYSADDYKDEFHYTFDQRLVGYGWGIREPSFLYRWVDEGNESEVGFALKDGHNYTLSCSIFIQPCLLNQFSAIVKNNPIQLQFSSIDSPADEYQWIRLEGEIPREFLEIGSQTIITFRMTPPTDPLLLEFYQKDDRQQDFGLHYVRGKFACRSIDLVRVEDR